MTPDEAILTLLEAVPNLNVHYGTVDTDEAAKIVQVDLPYVVVTTGLGEDSDERQGGRPGRRIVPFSVAYVGESSEQARWAANLSRDAVSRRRIVADGRESGLIVLRESSEIRPDRNYRGMGGQTLYYGTDKYAVGV